MICGDNSVGNCLIQFSNNSQETNTAHQPNSQALTTAHQLNNPARTMAHQLNNPAPTTAHPQHLTAFLQLKTSTTSTANVPTATNKLHLTNMVPQLKVHSPPKAHTRNPTTETATATALPTMDTQTADIRTEAMRNQLNTNSNMMFKTNRPPSISDTRNNAKVQLPLANITSCCPMVANR